MKSRPSIFRALMSPWQILSTSIRHEDLCGFEYLPTDTMLSQFITDAVATVSSFASSFALSVHCTDSLHVFVAYSS